MASAAGAIRQENDEFVPLLSKDASQHGKKKLSMFFGVVVPCILSIFSVILFLRLGFVVGQAGLGEGIGMLTLGYVVVFLTVLSISAICTNGAVEGGGAYFLISRSLGPEFGGAIGFIFYFANVFASALYVIGFVEAFLSNFGPQSQHPVFENSYGWKFLFGSLVLLFCLIVCLIGADLFAKTTFIIFLTVMTSVTFVIVSFIAQSEKVITFGADTLPCGSCYLCPNNNTDTCIMEETNKSCSSCFFRGWEVNTFKDNVKSNYTTDYTTGQMQTFQTVFAVLFNGCTGIMAGANMSGDLKNPSRAIPVGTLAALAITFVLYVVIMLCSAFTVSRSLLLYDYSFIEHIDLVPPVVTAGVFAATLSAALSTLIGSSRVLQALAKDDLFGKLLRPFSVLSGRKQEPLRAVLLSWLFVQLILLVGELNAIAPIVTMFFLLSYGVVNFACFALTVASAPNFRPTFHVFTWHTAFLGFIGCAAVMFFIEPVYATVAFALMIVLLAFVSWRAPVTPWGAVSQALIYHQVRKYLLRLDTRKDHVKFWRPQMLLLVANPRSSYQVMDFINDLKKGGLYVLGSVIVSDYNEQAIECYRQQLPNWIDFVDYTKLKAFVELTIAPSVRLGVRGLLMTSGLGGMKPNTVVLGYYDSTLPHEAQGICESALSKTGRFSKIFSQEGEAMKLRVAASHFPPLRKQEEEQLLSADDYVGIIQDSLLQHKNILVVRNFSSLHKNEFNSSPSTIDLWPSVQFGTAKPRSVSQLSASTFRGSSEDTSLVSRDRYDNTYFLILQLGYVLRMVHSWKNTHTLRIMAVVQDQVQRERQALESLLKDLRIDAEVKIVSPLGEQNIYRGHGDSLHLGEVTSFEWCQEMNQLMQRYSSQARVIFAALPQPPSQPNDSKPFLNCIDAISRDLPPVVMVYGSSNVICTVL